MTNQEAVRAFVASKGQADVKNGNGTIFSFKGILYSYGSHYQLAVFDGEGKIHINNKRYSGTTSSHRSMVTNTAKARGIEIIDEYLQISGRNASYAGIAGGKDAVDYLTEGQELTSKEKLEYLLLSISHIAE